jgi:hypothetical protein
MNVRIAVILSITGQTPMKVVLFCEGFFACGGLIFFGFWVCDFSFLVGLLVLSLCGWNQFGVVFLVWAFP